MANDCIVCAHAGEGATGVQRPAALVFFAEETVTKFVWNYNLRTDQVPSEVSNNLMIPPDTPNVLRCTGEPKSFRADDAPVTLCDAHRWVQIPPVPGLRVYVMAFRRMPTDLDRIIRGPEKPVRWRLEVAAKIANGIAHLHRCGIRHYDLKPENIFMSEDGEVYVSDFGLGRTFPVSNCVVYADGYRPPEVFFDGFADAPSDIYAFGGICLALDLWDPCPFWKRTIFEEAWMRYVPYRAHVDPDSVDWRVEAIGLWCLLIFHGAEWVRDWLGIFPGRVVWRALDDFLREYPQCLEFFRWGIDHDSPFVTQALHPDMRCRPTASALARYFTHEALSFSVNAQE